MALAFHAAGQSTSFVAVVIDSAWVTNQSGVFFETRLITRSNGESEQTVRRLGDTAQVLQLHTDRIRASSRTWAGDVETTSDYSRLLKEVIRQDAATKALLGLSPIEEILRPVAQAFIDSVYRIKIDGSVKAIKFSKTAQGVFRYKVDTFQTRNVSFLGSAMRLTNWLNTGKSMDLYQFRNGNWYSCTKDVQMYLKSVGAQARDVPDIAAFDEVMAPPSPILYDGGYASLGGVWYKWSAAKKTWAVVKKPKAPKASKL